MALSDPRPPSSSRSRRHTTPTTAHPQRPERAVSGVALESDESASSPERSPEDDADFFVVQNNDSQSSLGVTTLRDMSVSTDLEQRRRESPISRLPAELLIAIFVKLTSSADLRNCMLVSYPWAVHCVGMLWHRPKCNVWKNVINITASLSKHPFFPYHEMVKRLNLTTLHDKVNDGTIQPFMQCKRIERLTLTKCSNLTDFGLAGLLDGNKHLQALDVTDISSLTDHTLFAVSANCPRLQGLNIKNCSKITDESLATVADRCRQVKSLKFNNLPLITDESIIAFAQTCPAILEIDLNSCIAITSDAVTHLLSSLAYLRELGLAHCVGISDQAFLDLPAQVNLDHLRILDLTGCENVRDESLCRIIPATRKLRNLVLNKCRHITDRAVAAICRLGKTLQYIHLGHCVNLTDQAVIGLVKSCHRIRYIDLACCHRLTDQSVQHLAQLPKLRRIGLVKCQQLTDQSIAALAQGSVANGPPSLPRPPCLERVHLSYCVSLTLQGVQELLQFCPRLTHLSLTGVQAFLREDLTRFCREPPPEFNQAQREVFCVFSGEGVSRLRDHLKRLAEEQEREGRMSTNESPATSEPEIDSSRETLSEDGTIDGAEERVEQSPAAGPEPTGAPGIVPTPVGNGSHPPDQAHIPPSPPPTGPAAGPPFRPAISQPGDVAGNEAGPSSSRSHGDSYDSQDTLRGRRMSEVVEPRRRHRSLFSAVEELDHGHHLPAAASEGMQPVVTQVDTLSMEEQPSALAQDVLPPGSSWATPLAGIGSRGEASMSIQPPVAAHECSEGHPPPEVDERRGTVLR